MFLFLHLEPILSSQEAHEPIYKNVLQNKQRAPNTLLIFVTQAWKKAKSILMLLFFCIAHTVLMALVI